MQKCFGVDIGNSGLRLAELNLDARELGRMLRIDWFYADSDAAHRCSEANQRFLPTDRAWLEPLTRFVASTQAGANHSDSAQDLWLISSVRRDALEILHRHLSSIHARLQVVTYDALPLEINVQSPEKVGIDRLLAALASTELSDSRPMLVVQAGSAVTVDLVTASSNQAESGNKWLGCFEGGAILPGVPMMLRLLGKAADMLPELDADDLIDLPNLPGKNTEQAMICGTASALVGGVMHLISRYRAQFGREMPVILSGGDGMRLSPYLPQPLIVKPHLVHRGLLKLAESMNQTGGL